MRETLKRLAKLAAGYSLVTLIGPIFTILLTPLYTRVLTPADYGVVDVSLTLSMLIGIFVSLGMDQALNSFFFDGNEMHRRNLVTTAMLIAGSFGLIAAAGLILLAQPLALALFDDPSREITLRLLAIGLVATPLYAIAASALRLRMGVRRVNLLGIAYLIALISLNLIIVVGLGFKATGIIAANSFANLIGALAGILLLWKPLGGRFDARLGKRLLKTGAGLVPSVLGLVTLSSIDRLILTQYVTPEQLGLYSIANKLASMLTVIMNAGITAWIPIALEIGQKGETNVAQKQYARIYELFLATACILALALGLFSESILSIFTRSVYVPAAPYASMLMAYTGPILVSASLFSVGLYTSKQTKWLSFAYLVAAPLNIAANLILNERFGILGAVWATIIAGLALALVTLAVCQRMYHVPYRWPRAGMLAGIYTVLLTVHLTQNGTGPETYLWRVIFILLMVSAPFLIGIFSLDQVRVAGQLLANRVTQPK